MVRKPVLHHKDSHSTSSQVITQVIRYQHVCVITQACTVWLEPRLIKNGSSLWKKQQDSPNKHLVSEPGPQVLGDGPARTERSFQGRPQLLHLCLNLVQEASRRTTRGCNPLIRMLKYRYSALRMIETGVVFSFRGSVSSSGEVFSCQLKGYCCNSVKAVEGFCFAFFFFFYAFL